MKCKSGVVASARISHLPRHVRSSDADSRKVGRTEPCHAARSPETTDESGGKSRKNWSSLGTKEQRSRPYPNILIVDLAQGSGFSFRVQGFDQVDFGRLEEQPTPPITLC
jgi:hypothetical protein